MGAFGTPFLDMSPRRELTRHPQPDEFVDEQAEKDMDKLFRIRSKANSLLEQARKDGVVKSSLSADVAMSISTAATSDVIDLLGREEATLKSLFGVSGVTLCDRTLDTTPAWQYNDTLDVDGTFGPTISIEKGTDALCRYRDRTYGPPGGARKVPPLLDIHAPRRR